MRNLHVSLVLVIMFLVSCSKNDDTVYLTTESKIITNLHAPQQGGQGEPVSGEFTKFNFSTGQTTTSETAWDIAFRGTTIAVNGGTNTGTADEPQRTGEAAVAIVTGTFDEVTKVPEQANFKQDSSEGFAIPSGSNNGWYSYDFSTHTIAPIPGKILLFKTHDGKYAKVEILSYYKDGDTTGESRYYTFKYVYNPNKGQNTFENE